MKKLAILAGLMALALFVGVTGTALHTGTAQARPKNIVVFNPDVCFYMTGDTACYYLDQAGALDSVASDLEEGVVNDPDTYKTLVDASAAQLGSESDLPTLGEYPNTSSQSMWVIAFVSNGEDVTLNADEGIWASNDLNTTTLTPDDASDGYVVDLLYAGDSGPLTLGAASLTATQSGWDASADYTVVGPADDLSKLTATKTTVQEMVDPADCDLAEFTDEIKRPDVSGLVATIVDEHHTALTGIWAGWTTSDDDDLYLASDRTVSIAVGDVIAAENLGCGGSDAEADTVSVHGGILDVNALLTDRDVVIGDLSSDDEVDIAVMNAPASITLTAASASLICNGTNTVVITATVKDSAGNPVVAGNKVRFDVVALGTVSPIIATTDAKGVATTTLTPLSATTQGVTVTATLVTPDDGDEDQIVPILTDVMGNLRVDCQAAPTPVPPVVVPTTAPGGNITGPNTGDGGYLP